MNRAPLIFLGIFFAIAFSWTGIVLVNHVAYGRLVPHYDESEEKAFPEQIPGVALRGKQVYQELGCIYCHTQQVRRPGYGSDIERGWGERQSVARDYIRERRVLLGTMRTGPDLRNVGARISQEAGRDWHYRHFFDPVITSPGSNMPPYRFLYDYRPVVGEPSDQALQHLFTDEQRARYGIDKPGYELVPTERLQNLIAYLLYLNDTYEYPETKNVYVPAAPQEEAK